MDDDKQRPGETLKEFLDRQPKDAWVSFNPRILTKKDWLGLEPENMMARMTMLFNSASDRELASQLGGHIEVMLKRWVAARLVQNLGRSAFKSKYGRAQSHSKRIEIAHQAGLIDEKFVAILTSLAFVRNEFSHDPDLHWFEHSPAVVEELKKFPIPGSPIQAARLNFYLSACHAHSQLEKKMSDDHVIIAVSAVEKPNYSWRWR